MKYFSREEADPPLQISDSVAPDPSGSVREALMFECGVVATPMLANARL